MGSQARAGERRGSQAQGAREEGHLSEAPSFRCSNCGAPAQSRARRCSYCSAELKTVRCASCLVMNFAEALCCSGCGRELAASPLGSSPADLRCPRCATTLSRQLGQRGLLLDCSDCGGQFAEHSLLRDLLEQREKLGRFALRAPARRQLSLGEVRYLACPECRQVMNRKNFGGTSGIVVDVCHQHGIWFDHLELAGVLAFVETGGSAQPPLRAGKLEGAALTAAAVPSSASQSAADAGAQAGIELGVEGALEVAGELLSFVAGLVSD